MHRVKDTAAPNPNLLSGRLFNLGIVEKFPVMSNHCSPSPADANVFTDPSARVCLSQPFGTRIPRLSSESADAEDRV